MKHSIICRSIALVITLILVFNLSLSINAKYYHDNSGNVYVHKKTDKKLVALTFDDGPHNIKTDNILRVLEKYNVKATFFVIGENAQKYPDVLKRVQAGGHEIGNHTYDHKSIYKLSGEAVADEVNKCTQAIESITGQSPNLFRPPEGFMNDTLADIVGKHGYNVILWKVDTYDWMGKSAKEIFATVTKNVKNGDIILMHDYIWRKSNTADALDMIIPYMQEAGFQFCTVSELISE